MATVTTVTPTVDSFEHTPDALPADVDLNEVDDWGFLSSFVAGGCDESSYSSSTPSIDLTAGRIHRLEADGHQVHLVESESGISLSDGATNYIFFTANLDYEVRDADTPPSPEALLVGTVDTSSDTRTFDRTVRGRNPIDAFDVSGGGGGVDVSGVPDEYAYWQFELVDTYERFKAAGSNDWIATKGRDFHDTFTTAQDLSWHPERTEMIAGVAVNNDPGIQTITRSNSVTGVNTSTAWNANDTGAIAAAPGDLAYQIIGDATNAQARVLEWDIGGGSANWTTAVTGGDEFGIFPGAIAADDSGNVYVAHGNELFKLDGTGSITQTNSSAFGSNSTVENVALVPGGPLVACDAGQIVTFDTTLTVQNTDGNNERRCAVTSDGQIVAGNNDGIRVYDTTLTQQQSAGVYGLIGGITTAPNGELMHHEAGDNDFTGGPVKRANDLTELYQHYRSKFGGMQLRFEAGRPAAFPSAWP